MKDYSHSLDCVHQNKMNSLFFFSHRTVITEKPRLQTNKLCFLSDQNRDGTMFTLRQTRQMGGGTHAEQREGAVCKSENVLSTYYLMILCTHCRIQIISHWCQEKNQHPKWRTPCILYSIISQTNEATLYGKRTGSFFLATWKDILHLAHISWIRCIPKQTQKKNNKKHSDESAEGHMSEIYCTWTILLLSLFFCTSMFNSSVSQARGQNEQSSTRAGSRKYREYVCVKNPNDKN